MGTKGTQPPVPCRVRSLLWVPPSSVTKTADWREMKKQETSQSKLWVMFYLETSLATIAWETPHRSRCRTVPKRWEGARIHGSFCWKKKKKGNMWSNIKGLSLITETDISRFSVFLRTRRCRSLSALESFLSFFFLCFYFIFKLYIIVLVLPNIKMNPPQVYMCSPSWTLLPPPSPYHPSGSSQFTSPKHPVSCIIPFLCIVMIYSQCPVFLHREFPSGCPTGGYCSGWRLDGQQRSWFTEMIHNIFLSTGL